MCCRICLCALHLSPTYGTEFSRDRELYIWRKGFVVGHRFVSAGSMRIAMRRQLLLAHVVELHFGDCTFHPCLSFALHVSCPHILPRWHLLHLFDMYSVQHGVARDVVLTQDAILLSD